MKEFCRVYGERLRAPFSLHARADTVTLDLLRRLADAGCRHITFGVESGSPRVRREIMKRLISDERIKDAFRWSKDLGILTTANHMLGLPGETREDLELTLALHEELRPDDFGYFVFYPYPGTDLYRVCLERGYLPPPGPAGAAGEPPHLDPAQHPARARRHRRVLRPLHGHPPARPRGAPRRRGGGRDHRRRDQDLGGARVARAARYSP